MKASGRLKDNAAILTASGGLSLEMEKVLNSMPAAEKVESVKVLELNAGHPIFAKLQSLYKAKDKAKKDTLKQYAEILYDQACLIEGLPVADPVDYANRVNSLLAK